MCAPAALSPSPRSCAASKASLSAFPILVGCVLQDPIGAEDLLDGIGVTHTRIARDRGSPRHQHRRPSAGSAGSPSAYTRVARCPVKRRGVHVHEPTAEHIWKEALERCPLRFADVAACRPEHRLVIHDRQRAVGGVDEVRRFVPILRENRSQFVARQETPGASAQRAPARAATRRSARSRPRRRSAPASPAAARAFSTDGQRRWTSTSKVGRWASSKSAGSRPQASQTMRAISATVSSRAAEMLKSSLSPAGEDIAVDDAVGDVVDVGERARLLARAEDLQRRAGRRAPCGSGRARRGRCPARRRASRRGRRR